MLPSCKHLSLVSCGTIALCLSSWPSRKLSSEFKCSGQAGTFMPRCCANLGSLSTPLSRLLFPSSNNHRRTPQHDHVQAETTCEIMVRHLRDLRSPLDILCSGSMCRLHTDSLPEQQDSGNGSATHDHFVGSPIPSTRSQSSPLPDYLNRASGRISRSRARARSGTSTAWLSVFNQNHLQLLSVIHLK